MENKKILIIDDEPDFVKMLKMRLEFSGYEVAIAFDGDEGLEILRKEIPDLILLDIMMPNKDGYTFLLDMKKDERTREIPVIALTAKAGMKDLFELEGAKDYIVKPFESEHLLAKIREVVGE